MWMAGKNVRLRRAYVALGSSALLVAALVTWQALSRHPSHPRQPTSTMDLDRRACLLTTRNADATTVGRVWAGMQGAANRTPHLLVQRFAVPPQTPPRTMLTTLTQMRCQTIVTVGPQLATAAFAQNAGPHTPRLIVISDRPSGASGPVTLRPTAATSSAIAQAIGA